jgi:hypothetical protein
MASISSCLPPPGGGAGFGAGAAAAGLGAGGGGAGFGAGAGCAAAAGGGGAAGFDEGTGGSFAEDVAGSASSAMIRRMEARISSMDGSWALALCDIAYRYSAKMIPARFANRERESISYQRNHYVTCPGKSKFNWDFMN